MPQLGNVAMSSTGLQIRLTRTQKYPRVNDVTGISEKILVWRRPYSQSRLRTKITICPDHPLNWGLKRTAQLPCRSLCSNNQVPRQSLLWRVQCHLFQLLPHNIWLRNCVMKMPPSHPRCLKVSSYDDQCEQDFSFFSVFLLKVVMWTRNKDLHSATKKNYIFITYFIILFIVKLNL